MSSVASSMVATLMNSSIGTNQKNTTNNTSTNFAQYLNSAATYKTMNKSDFNTYVQSKSSQSRNESIKTNDTASQKVESKQFEDSKQTSSQAKSETKETSDSKGTENVTNKEEIKSDKTKLSKEVDKAEEALEALETLEERIGKVEEQIIAYISEMLGVDEESLNSLMMDMNLSALDFLKMENLSSLVGDVFGLEDFTQMLLNEDATSMLKKLDEGIETLVKDIAEELGMAEEELQSMIESGLAGTTSQNVDQALVQEATNNSSVNDEVEVIANDESVKLEVVDERTGNQTTEYSQDNAGKEDQSFASLLSNNADMTKEVAVNNGSQVVYKEVSANEVIDQIVTKAVVKLTDDKSTMEIQLNPGHLGKIGVSITSEQGLVKGQFIAENQVVKEMLESNMIQLKEQLEGQGIKVDKIEVTVGNSNRFFDGNKEQQHQSKEDKANKRRVSRLTKLRNISEVVDMFKEEEVVINNSTGDVVVEHTVDFSA